MSLAIAVLISGSGSNLQSIIDSIEIGRLDARIELVISNKPDAFGLERAKKHGIPYRVVPHAHYPVRTDYDTELIKFIRESGAHAVVLAGFMRILTPGFIRAFENRILNIHPALLPAFPGVSGQKQAAEYGSRISGCTVHVVDEKMDNGPVIIQAAVPCPAGDDLADIKNRILAFEHRIYPQAVQWLAQDRLKITGRKAAVVDAPEPAVYSSGNIAALVCPGFDPGF
ncbi:MAG: phosphoribosylglycinamide formyltransferase [Thermodesulfobacteriota bacterium]